MFSTVLKRMDRTIRAAERSFLGLSHDSPDSFLYAGVKEGGLGIPCLSVSIHLAKRQRQEKVFRSSDPLILACSTGQSFRADVSRWSRPLTVGSELVTTEAEARAAMMRRLYATHDGAGLRQA